MMLTGLMLGVFGVVLSQEMFQESMVNLQLLGLSVIRA
jgi:hypothetical protein